MATEAEAVEDVVEIVRVRGARGPLTVGLAGRSRMEGLAERAVIEVVPSEGGEEGAGAPELTKEDEEEGRLANGREDAEEAMLRESMAEKLEVLAARMEDTGGEEEEKDDEVAELGASYLLLALAPPPGVVEEVGVLPEDVVEPRFLSDSRASEGCCWWCLNPGPSTLVRFFSGDEGVDDDVWESGRSAADEERCRRVAGVGVVAADVIVGRSLRASSSSVPAKGIMLLLAERSPVGDVGVAITAGRRLSEPESEPPDLVSDVWRAAAEAGATSDDCSEIDDGAATGPGAPTS